VPEPTRSFLCWAASCDDCDRGPSDEHLLSKALFPDKALNVQGFDWCREQKRVGINSLTRQILCAKHNNDLSPADAEAVKAIALFRSQSRPPEPGAPPVDRDVDGRRLEQWLLKTAINLAFRGADHIGLGMTGSQPGVPPPYLLEVAFGRLKFTHLLGAHFLIPEGECLHSPDEITVIPLIRNGEIGGFFFELRSQAIFLNLFPGHAPASLGAVSELPLSRELLDARLVYRPPQVACAVNNFPTGLVRFRWNPEPR
jgi:hypothetical protein